MTKETSPDALASRREFLYAAGLGVLAAGSSAPAAAQRAVAPAASANAAVGGKPGQYNILFILTDQERYFRPGELPEGYSLPAHERLRRQGISFTNHRINSCVCTSSRSVLLGQRAR